MLNARETSMARRTSTAVFVLFVLFASTCSSDAPPPPNPGPTVAVSASGPVFEGPLPSPPLDPCINGSLVDVDGWTVIVPAWCASPSIDEGDPPPEQVSTQPGPEELEPADLAPSEEPTTAVW